MFVLLVARVAGSAAQCEVVEAYCLCAAGCSYACESRLHARKQKCIAVRSGRVGCQSSWLCHMMVSGTRLCMRGCCCCEVGPTFIHALESVSSNPQASRDIRICHPLIHLPRHEHCDFRVYTDGIFLHTHSEELTCVLP